MAEVEEEQAVDKNVIQASPTKSFFISMIVRDLTLEDAIGDLVDNCVDGARLLRPDKKYDGLYVKITANENEFVIEDNCGGISAETARSKAFRFGRPDRLPPNPGSIGQFGIGMKRALFKLGDKFTITSIAANSTFKMTVNVPEWAKDEKKWDFIFEELKEDLPEIPVEKRGTKIVVTELKQDVKDQFNNNIYIGELQDDIELENLYHLHQGLNIKINGRKLKARSLELKEGNGLTTAFWEHDFGNGMIVKIFAGIGEAKQEDGGWYIFCNDRLVLGPERTEITGWVGGKNKDVGPSYHHQYRRFRGYVFFESDNPALLPWTTTKNNVELDSPVYKFVRQRMIQMMKPINALQNAIKVERENGTEPEERPLEQFIDKSKSVALADISPAYISDVFSYPDLPRVKKKSPDEYLIKYYKPKTIVDKVKKNLGAKNLAEVGEKTFDYFYEMEIGD